LRRASQTLLCLLAVTCLSACAPRLRGVELPVAMPEGFSRSGTEAMAEHWWTSFGDPRLDELVEEALRSNPGVMVAWERLLAAQAVHRREGSGFFPSLEALVDGEQRFAFDGPTEAVGLALAARYEVDLWGRIRSGVQAERHRAEASRADYRTVTLSLAAEVSATWFRALEAEGRVRLLEQQVGTIEQELALLEDRFVSGQVRQVDLIRQRQLLEGARMLTISARADRDLARQQLAVLLGRPPQTAVELNGAELPALPPLPDAGLPAELVQRRPDVLRAHHLLLAADRDLAVAVAERYPQLALSARGGTGGALAGVAASDFFSAWFVALAARLVAPIFEGGKRKAEVARNTAIKRQRLYEYGHVALQSLLEVEDALIREAEQRDRRRSLAIQAELALAARERLQSQYENGVSDFLDVLSAVKDEQRLRRDLLAARRAELLARVALYRALAGGFEGPQEQP
jgi:NodT family efflux transporter outer membrane factor (OMF) lipoprotein